MMPTRDANQVEIVRSSPAYDKLARYRQTRFGPCKLKFYSSNSKEEIPILKYLYTKTKPTDENCTKIFGLS